MISIEVTGNEEIARDMNKGVSIADALKKLAFNVEAFAKKATVVDTGRLRSSINTKLAKVSAVIGTNVDYAEFIEYGTHTMEARHMEGATKVLGQGMFEYTEEQMGNQIKDFETSIIKDVEKRF